MYVCLLLGCLPGWLLVGLVRVLFGWSVGGFLIVVYLFVGSLVVWVVGWHVGVWVCLFAGW